MGKMILIVVMGSYLILGSFVLQNNNTATETVENVVNYYTIANTKQIATSGANVALSHLYKVNSWRTGLKSTKFSGGKYRVTLKDDFSLGAGGVKIFSAADFMGHKDTVIVSLRLAPYSNYLYFVDKFPQSGYFITGDTVYGKYHTNGKLAVSGKPVFWGKVTMKDGPYKGSNWYAKPDPQFYGGYEYGIEIPFPDNIDPLKASAQSGGYYVDKELWINLMGDKIAVRTSKTGKDSIYNISSIAPNGIFFSNKKLHIKGKVSGNFTIASNDDIWLDDDVTVTNDPRIDPQSKDMLGIVSKKNVIITDNIPNLTDIKITAAVYAGDEFYAENWSKRPFSGYIDLYGSLAQKEAGFTGSGEASGGSKVLNGFNERYQYDDRFLMKAPAGFPSTGRYEILSWWG